MANLIRLQSATLNKRHNIGLPLGKICHVFFICQHGPNDNKIKQEIEKRLEHEGFKCGEFLPGMTTSENVYCSFKSSVAVVPLITKDFNRNSRCKDYLEVAKTLQIQSGEKNQPMIIPLTQYLQEEEKPHAIITVNSLDISESLDKWFPIMKRALMHALEKYRNDWTVCMDLITDLPIEEKEKVAAALINPEFKERAPTCEIEMALELIKTKTEKEKLNFICKLFEADEPTTKRLKEILENPSCAVDVSIECTGNQHHQEYRTFNDILSSLNRSQFIVVILTGTFAFVGICTVAYFCRKAVLCILYSIWRS